MVRCIIVLFPFILDLLALTDCVKELFSHTRSARTIVWCAMQMLHADVSTHSHRRSDSCSSQDRDRHSSNSWSTATPGMGSPYDFSNTMVGILTVKKFLWGFLWRWWLALKCWFASKLRLEQEFPMNDKSSICFQGWYLDLLLLALWMMIPWLTRGICRFLGYCVMILLSDDDMYYWQLKFAFFV